MRDTMDGILSTLNCITGEGINYYPDGCDSNAIEALITDYFVDGPSDNKDGQKNAGWY